MLNADDIARFREQGYLVVNGVLDDDDFAALRSEYAGVLAEMIERHDLGESAETASAEGPRSFEERLLDLASRPGFDLALLAELDITLPHMPFTVIRSDSQMHVGPAVLGLLTHPAILDVVEAVLGGEIMASPNQHCRLKLPVQGGPSPFGGRKGETMYAPTMWHQDAMTQLPASDATEVLTCWIPTDDVKEENGCLCVVPGAHTEKRLLPWPLDEQTVAWLESHAVPLPVRRGDIVLLDKRVPHGSRVNRADRVRWSFDFRYYPASQPCDRPFFPSIVARSRNDPDTVQSDAQEWRERWLTARERLAVGGQPVPGRREFAQVVADALIKRWEAGDYGVPLYEGTESAVAAG